MTLFDDRDAINVVRAALTVLYSTEAGSDSAIRAYDAASGALDRLRVVPSREAFERRERLIREYQRRARAAVRVLTERNLTDAYLLAYRDLADKATKE